MTFSRTRWIISLLTILGTFPYIGLKLLWLSGSRIGLSDPEFGHGTVMVIANTLTMAMAMDAVAIVMALAFVTAWGRRLPAWLVLFPMWVGTGLLGPIGLIVPLQLLLGSPATTEAGELPPIADWVFAMVYAGFIWQAAFLLTGFVLYARSRWGDRLGWSRRGWPRTGVPGVPLAVGVTLLGGLALVTHVSGVFRPQAANVIGDVTMVVLAAAGLMLIAGWAGRSLPRWVGLLMWWLGSGAMTAWAFYLAVVMLVPNDLLDLDGIAWGDLTAQAVRVLAGLTCVMTGARVLRRAGTASSSSASVRSGGRASISSGTASGSPRA